jgi:uncharacterized protein
MSEGKACIDDIIAKNGLLPHPEGGYYKETYRSDVSIKTLVKGVECKRSASTAIVFLICDGNVSRLHKIESDEIWHFYSGGALTVVEVDDMKKTVTKILVNAENPQYTVKRGKWFGSYCEPGVSYSFVGCTVAPGFEFEDFELANKAKMKNCFAGDEESLEIIEKMCIGL